MKLTILISLLPLLASTSAAPTEPQAAQIGPALTSPYLPVSSEIEYSHSQVHTLGKRLYKETYYVDLFNKNYMWVMIEDDKNGTMAKTTRWEHRVMLSSGGPSISSASATGSAVKTFPTSASSTTSKPVSASVSKAVSSSTVKSSVSSVSRATSSSAAKVSSSAAATSKAASSSVASPRPSSVSSRPASSSASVSKAVVSSSISKAAVSSSMSKAAVSSSVSKSATVSSSISRAPISSSTSKAAALSTAVSASSAAAPSASVAAGVSAAEQAQFLTLHNQFRARYSARAVVWDDTLASFALKTAQTCKYGHTGGPYGENIAAGVGGGYNIDRAFSSWANEDALYDFNKPGYSSATGHFTQIVWKGTGKIGCAAASCADGTIFTGYGANSTYVVCEYQAPGNVVSSDPARTAQIFTANVGPKVA